MVNEKKHTPFPWSKFKQDGGFIIILSDQGTAALVDLPRVSDPASVQEANADLILSIPSLQFRLAEVEKQRDEAVKAVEDMRKAACNSFDDYYGILESNCDCHATEDKYKPCPECRALAVLKAITNTAEVAQAVIAKCEGNNSSGGSGSCDSPSSLTDAGSPLESSSKEEMKP